MNPQYEIIEQIYRLDIDSGLVTQHQRVAQKELRAARLSAAKNDDDHRAFKRELDNVDRDMRETQRRADDTEAKIEQSKSVFHKAESELKKTIEASEDERNKAQHAEENSAGRLSEIQAVRDTYMSKLDDRICQHYQRVSKITRSPNGPICRVVEGACGNCRIGLSPQILNNILRAKSIEFCPFCCLPPKIKFNPFHQKSVIMAEPLDPVKNWGSCFPFRVFCPNN